LANINNYGLLNEWDYFVIFVLVVGWKDFGLVGNESAHSTTKQDHGANENQVKKSNASEDEPKNEANIYISFQQ
jgi:hypothetical protein